GSFRSFGCVLVSACLPQHDIDDATLKDIEGQAVQIVAAFRREIPERRNARGMEDASGVQAEAFLYPIAVGGHKRAAERLLYLSDERIRHPGNLEQLGPTHSQEGLDRPDSLPQEEDHGKLRKSEVSPVLTHRNEGFAERLLAFGERGFPGA